MIRQHQFTKVELVSITTPEESKNEHERMLACAEDVLKKLDLHYRVIMLCTATWVLLRKRLTTSRSGCRARTCTARFRPVRSAVNSGAAHERALPRQGQQAGIRSHAQRSGVAVGRALIAVMETYQQEDGSILVPDALKPYMGGMTKIEKK